MTNPSEACIAAALALADKMAARAPAKEVADAVEAYRATAPKLRTRAEVDAEIGGIMRDVYRAGLGSVSYSVDESLRLSRLCAEPTTPTDSGPSSDSASPSALPTGAAYSRLLGRIARLERATEYAPYQGKHQALREIRDELKRDASGPRPIPATKESSDTAGVDAGVTNPEDDGPRYVPWHCPLNCECRAAPASEPNRVTNHDADMREAEIQAGDYEDDQCGCDESEGLKKRITAILDCVILSHGSSYRVRDIVPARLKEGL